MSGKRQTVRLEEHLWSQLDGMADGLGASADVLLERAVLTLLALHGYAVPRRPAVATTEPGVPPFKAKDPFAAVVLSDVPASAVVPQPLGAPVPTKATRVEGVSKNAPVVTGVTVGHQPTPPGGSASPRLKQVPPTANLRAPLHEPEAPGLGEEEVDHPTQISLAHASARIPSEELASAAVDSGSLPEPVAAGELVTSPRRAGDAPVPLPVKFPEAGGADDEPPFVSDVISVPPELYAPDAGAPSALTQAPAGEEEAGEASASEETHGVSEETHAVSEETHAVSEVTHGVSEMTHAPVSEEFTAPRSEAFTAPRSEAFTAPRSEAFTAPRSEAFTAPRSDPMQLPVSETFVPPIPEEADALVSGALAEPPRDTTQDASLETFVPPVSEVTHAPVSEEVPAAVSDVTQVPGEVVTHGLLPEDFSPPISELAPAAEPAPPQESETQGLSPEDVPWQTEPEPPAPERVPVEAAEVPVPAPPPVYEEEAPPPPPPDPDADPARRAASTRIHAIAAELEQWVLPREDRSFNIDLPAAGAAEQGSQRS